MKPTKIISIKRNKKGNIDTCTCDDKATYRIAALARIIGISRPSLVSRLKEWGYKHPDIMRERSAFGRTGNNRVISINVSIVDGDLQGKYLGKKNEVERRKLLDAIPGPGSFELEYLS